MRTRTKMKGLVSHTKPTGKSYITSESRCRMQLHRLQKLLNEGYEIIETMNNPQKREDSKVVMVFNKPMNITLQEYNEHFTLTLSK